MVRARPFVGLRPDTDDLSGVLARGRAGRDGPPRPQGIEQLLGFVPEGGSLEARIAHARRARHDPALAPFVLLPDHASGIDVLRLDDGRADPVWGLVVLLAAGDPALHPHEAVVSAPADDRRLLRAGLGLDAAPITVVRRRASPADVAPPALPTGPPTQDATAPDGVRHQSWRIEDAGLVERAMVALEGEDVLVADGHHRLAAARAHAEASGLEDARWLLAYVTEPDAAPRLGSEGRVTDLEQVWTTALDGGVLPPKSTRFGPKPRAGLVLRALGDTAS